MNWIGGGIPITSHQKYQAHARWAAIQCWYYWHLHDVMDVPDRYAMFALDIGCAGGSHTKMLASFYLRVHGIDRQQELINFAMTNNSDENLTFSCSNWPESNIAQKYDRIFAVETLEHMGPTERDAAIASALDSLTPDGLLGFSIPNEPQNAPWHPGAMRDEEVDQWLDSLKAKVVLRSWFSNKAPGDPCSEWWDPWSDTSASHHAIILGAP